jgi:hypothetical protein
MERQHLILQDFNLKQRIYQILKSCMKTFHFPVPDALECQRESLMYWHSESFNSAKFNAICNIYLLKPNGYIMHRQFNIQQLSALPSLCLSENKQRLVSLTA